MEAAAAVVVVKQITKRMNFYHRRLMHRVWRNCHRFYILPSLPSPPPRLPKKSQSFELLDRSVANKKKAYTFFMNENFFPVRQIVGRYRYICHTVYRAGCMPRLVELFRPFESNNLLPAIAQF